jgi:cytochrome b561
VLVLLVAMHVGAALFHYLIRKDGVLARMLPSAGRRDGK